MADEFNIIPYRVRSAGTDVPPEEVQQGLNSLAFQTTIALNSLAGGGGTIPAGNVTFTQIGSTLTQTVQQKLTQVVSLADFPGYDPTGATDSTAALVAATSSLGANGGEVTWTGTCLINSAFTLPSGVSLVGGCDSPGFQASEIYTGSTFESVLVINPAITVSMSSRSCVRKALILSKVISPLGAFPTPFGLGNAAAAIAAFSGTAFTPLNNCSDNRLEDVLVLGFSLIYDGRGVGSNARPIFRRVQGDNTNGIFVSNVTDDGFGENCKMWPFTTAVEGGTNPVFLLRSGTGFYSELVSQGMTWTNCEAYGYAIGHDVNAIRNIRQVNCTVDSASASTSIGFQYRGAINNCINVGAEIAGQGGSGVLINITPDGNSDSINLVGCNFHGSNSANGYINVVAGNATATACHFDGNSSFGHVNLQSSATLYTESDCTHAGVATGQPFFGNATAIANAQVLNPKNIGTFTNAAINTVSAFTINDQTTAGTSALTVIAPNDTNGANIKITGNGVTTPSKTIRVASGSFRVTNNAYAADILTLTDAGVLSTPGGINGTSITGGAGSFTTLAASGTVSGTGFSTYLASPPAIGGTAPAAGAFTTLSSTGNFTPSQTNGIVGTTTNNNANAGSVGEFPTPTNLSAVPLTSAVTANASSVSLTAGDWDVTGVVSYVAGAATVLTGIATGISTTSATAGAAGTFAGLNLSFTAATTQNLSAPVVRISLAATTTVYLIANAGFASGSCTASGFLRARRVR